MFTHTVPKALPLKPWRTENKCGYATLTNAIYGCEAPRFESRFSRPLDGLHTFLSGASRPRLRQSRSGFPFGAEVLWLSRVYADDSKVSRPVLYFQ